MMTPHNRFVRKVFFPIMKSLEVHYHKLKVFSFPTGFVSELWFLILSYLCHIQSSIEQENQSPVLLDMYTSG